jgi:hypothetical protein
MWSGQFARMGRGLLESTSSSSQDSGQGLANSSSPPNDIALLWRRIGGSLEPSNCFKPARLIRISACMAENSVFQTLVQPAGEPLTMPDTEIMLTVSNDKCRR